MSGGREKIAVCGAGVVTPAGWGVAAMRAALAGGAPVESQPFLGADGTDLAFRRRPVPKPETKLPFLRHPRLRRSSPAGRFLAAAALEAIGDRSAELGRLAVVVTSYTGNVNYSQRFYREVLDDPATASPIVFPETVFNAPASHLSALLETDEVNYTLVGDESQYIAGLELATRWLLDDEADSVLVAATEESDWLTASALDLFRPGTVVGEGAAALLLGRSDRAEVEVGCLTDVHTITANRSREAALREMRGQLQGQAGDPVYQSGHEGALWGDWDGVRHCIGEVFGEGFGVSVGWSCVAAVASLQAGEADSALVSGAGTNQGCAGARFIKNT